MLSPLPRRNCSVRFTHIPLQWQPSPISWRVGFRITYFEACSAFTRVTACMLAKFLYRTLYTRGFSRFVTSTTAPIATGWSESCRAGFAPAERQRLTWRTKNRTLSVRRGGHPAIQRWNGHAEVPGHVLGRDAAGEQLLGRLDLAVGHLGLATALAAELAGDFQPGSGAFDGQLALHFGEAGHDVEEEAAGRRAGVDGVGEAPELDTVLVQIADQIDQLLDRPAQPVELPDDQGVALAHHFEGLGQTGTVCPRATYLVLEDLLASGLGQRFALKFQVLILRRDARIADQHGLSRARSMRSCIACMTSSWVYDLALGSSASRRASSTSRVIRSYSSGHSTCSMRSDA